MGHKRLDKGSAFFCHKEFKAPIAAFLEMGMAYCKVIACAFCAASVIDQPAA